MKADLLPSMNAAADRVLLVDDDSDIRELVTSYLQRDNFVVVAVPDGRTMKKELADHDRFDLIILDYMLPGDNGLELIRWLSTSPSGGVPVLMLTARADDIDRIIGLESGADDYLAKPFVPRELSARIRAILRRARSLPDTMRLSQMARFIRFGKWRLDMIERCLLANDNTVTPLTTAEYGLLVFFVDNPGKIVSRDQLIDLLIGVDSSPFDRAIDLRVSRLRRRLGDDPRDPSYIRTIRNEGYIFLKEIVRECDD